MHTMKIRPIGQNRGEFFIAAILTPEEYLHHPAYHPFVSISSTYLFAYSGESWFGVDPSRSSAYAVLEATDNERKQLKDAGYRMLNL